MGVFSYIRVSSVTFGYIRSPSEAFGVKQVAFGDNLFHRRSLIGKYLVTLQWLSWISGKLVDRRKYWRETWVSFVCFASVMFLARSNARFGDPHSICVLIHSLRARIEHLSVHPTSCFIIWVSVWHNRLPHVISQGYIYIYILRFLAIGRTADVAGPPHWVWSWSRLQSDITPLFGPISRMIHQRGSLPRYTQSTTLVTIDMHLTQMAVDIAIDGLTHFSHLCPPPPCWVPLYKL